MDNFLLTPPPPLNKTPQQKIWLDLGGVRCKDSPPKKKHAMPCSSGRSNGQLLGIRLATKASFLHGILRWATKKTFTSFRYTSCLIGILTMVYYNPHITGQYNPLYNLNNQGFFHCSGRNSRIRAPGLMMNKKRTSWISLNLQRFYGTSWLGFLRDSWLGFLEGFMRFAWIYKGFMGLPGWGFLGIPWGISGGIYEICLNLQRFYGTSWLGFLRDSWLGFLEGFMRFAWIYKGFMGLPGWGFLGIPGWGFWRDLWDLLEFTKVLWDFLVGVS